MNNSMTPATTHGQPAANGATGLVVFAQRDVWSALQSLMWCKSNSALEALCVYHTPESAGDAERLRRFCARQWPELKVIVPGEPGTALAAKVVERLRDWRLFRSELQRWVIDCSGAEPSMLAGVSRAATEDAAWNVMRRRPDGAWERLTAASGGRLNPEPLVPAPAADIADGLSFADLFTVLPAEGDVEPVWRESRPPEQLAAAQLARIVTAGAACNWDWRQMFEQAEGRACPNGDWGFDDFLGAALVALGVANTRVHLRLRLAAKRPCEQLFDVAAIRNGILWLFDCQFRAEGETGAPADARLWSQFAARRVVLRPGRWATATERLLAAGGGNTLLDGDDCRTLFSRLAELLGCELPAELRSLERGTLSTGASRLPVFSPATPAQQFSDAIHVAPCTFDLQRGARADAGGTPPPWLAARVASDLWFLGGSVPNPVQVQELRQRLDERLARSRLETAVIFFEMTHDRLHWRALVRMKSEGAALGRWLQRWQGVPLIV